MAMQQKDNAIRRTQMQTVKGTGPSCHPSGCHALRDFVLPLRFGDVLGMSKGGFLVGTYGMEEHLRAFAAAYRALPAVVMKEIGRKGNVVLRHADYDGESYFYVVNAGLAPMMVKLAVPPGTRNLVTGMEIGGFWGEKLDLLEKNWLPHCGDELLSAPTRGSMRCNLIEALCLALERHPGDRRLRELLATCDERVASNRGLVAWQKGPIVFAWEGDGFSMRVPYHQRQNAGGASFVWKPADGSQPDATLVDVPWP